MYRCVVCIHMYEPQINNTMYIITTTNMKVLCLSNMIRVYTCIDSILDKLSAELRNCNYATCREPLLNWYLLKVKFYGTPLQMHTHPHTHT